MADNQIAEQDTHFEEVAEAKGAKPEKPAGKNSNGILWALTLLSLVLCVAIAGSGYWFFSQHHSQLALRLAQSEATNAMVPDLTKQVGQDAQALKNLQRQQDEAQRTISSLQAQLETTAAEANALSSALQEMNGRRPSDWLLAESEYMVKMAGRKVWLDGDVRTAIMLLQNADTRLAELSDPSVLPVRKLIAQDIRSLQQVNKTEPVSIALAISGLLSQVPQIKLDGQAIPTSPQYQPAPMTESVSDWQQNLAAVWHNIVDDFISVSKVEQPIAPLMSLEQQWLAREQLTLFLLQAQSAALKAQPTLYQQSLEAALGVLNQQFDLTDAATHSYISGVQNLLSNDVSKALPSELVSQGPLSDLLLQRVGNLVPQGASAL